MDNGKEFKVATFRDWLIMQDIQFKEKANGHFQIFDEESQELKYQVWATTEKMVDNPSDRLQQKQWIGMAKIQSVLRGADVTLTNSVSDIRQKFLDVYKMNKGHMYDCILVVAVHLPSGATEIITNHYEVESKMDYYIEAYDDEFKLKKNPAIQITGFMLV